MTCRQGGRRVSSCASSPASTRRREHIWPQGAQVPESREHKKNRRPDPSSPTATYRSDVELDQNMMDRKILASVLMNVDVTEVYRPIQFNELAAKFGLVPWSSLDLMFFLESEKVRRSSESMA